MTENDRRKFLERMALASGALLLGGCDKLADSKAFKSLLATADRPTDAALHALTSEDALAQEFTEADISPVFKANGSTNPKTPEYLAMLANGFADWKLRIGGLVKSPLELDMAQLRALPSRTQITRHDCVEGWSCIGKWRGVPLGRVLDLAGVMPGARYLLFRCADSLDNDERRYYESIYVSEAYHPQSILAYELNDQVLDVPHGAPLRVRLERKLGYKQAKYLVGIDLVQSMDGVGGGKGGYWEDQGYQWHGGI
jgi:DMSO/TMAO reductase YedYZ molybdopterin-dependent catalytic subunit